MRRLRIVSSAVLVFGVAWLAPAAAYAWGASAHRFIMRRALELLPPEIKPFFDRNHDEIVVRVMDPDMWRTAGFDEDSNHFVDFGVPEYGPFPFLALPRDYDQAVAKFGVATVKRNGLLPWRLEELHGQLRRAFEAYGRGSGLAATDIVLFTGAASHYIQDAHMPLHASNNFDGQLSGQRGVHSRFESELFERFESKIVVNPGGPVPVDRARDLAFDVLLESSQAVPGLLQADKSAADGRETYDDSYFEKFFALAGSMMQQRLALSITRTASIIVSAWTAAGKPSLMPLPPKAPQKVSR